MNEAVAFIGISRHRIDVDSVGVTTLAAFYGCTLRCRYCLNAICVGSLEGLEKLTPEKLFDRIEWLKSIGITKIDKFNYIIRDKK